MRIPHAFNKALAVSFAGTALLVAANVPAMATPADAQGCVIYADPPVGVGSDVSGAGGRVGCTDHMSVTVKIFHVEPYGRPDFQVAERTGAGVDFEVAANGPCVAWGRPGEYYTIATSERGYQDRSENVWLC